MTALYTRVASGALFPLHERLKGHHSVALRRQLERTQWLSPDDLCRLRDDRLRHFIMQVYQRVPYYRRLLDGAGIRPTDITGVDALRRLPLLDKAAIRANLDDLKAEGAGPLRRFNTGGSSGEPLVFCIGKDRVSHDVAAKWRATRWWDVDIGDREIVVWGSPIELGAQDRLRLVRDRLLRTRLVPAFELSPSKMDQFLAEIRGFRPRMLFGYPSSLALLARHAEYRGYPMSALGIQVAFVTSERLYDEQRDDIQRVFGCRVANGYGGRDAGFIAHECPHGRMHISAEDIIVEILDANGQRVANDVAGEITVTHLATPSFPFIRYRTGDVGALSDEICPCGRGLPVLGRLDGRSTDFIVSSDGTVMHGLALIYVLRDMPGIDEFKIIQESLALTRVLVKPGRAFGADAITSIQTQFRRRLGAGVQVQIEPVAEIPRERSGKYRYVVSHVADGVTSATGAWHHAEI